MIIEEVRVERREERSAAREPLVLARRRISGREAASTETPPPPKKTGHARKTTATGRTGSHRLTQPARKAVKTEPPRTVTGPVRAFTKRELERGARKRNEARRGEPREPRMVSIHPSAAVAAHAGRLGASMVAPARPVEVPPAPPDTAARRQRAGMMRGMAGNIMMLFSGQIVTWVSALILSAAYGRFLGAVGFGELYLATTFTSLIGFPIEFSFNQQIVRDVAQDPRAAHRYITTALALKGALWVALFLLALALSIALGYSPEERWLIAICGIMLISTAVSTTLISIQTAYMQIGFAKFGVVLEKGIDCIAAILLLRAGAGVQAVALVLLAGSVVGMAWQGVRVAQIIGVRVAWDTQVARSLIRSGVSFLAYGLLGVIYYRVDTVLLSMFATNAAVGVYGAAYRLFDTLTFLPGLIIGGIVSPMMAKYFIDKDSKLRITVEKSTLAMLLCSAPVAAGLIVSAPNIIWFVYHRSDFMGSIVVLEVLAVGLVALYLNTVLTTVLVSIGQERKLPLMAAVALVFNVALNLALIPRFMDVGAAWATSITELFLLGIGVALIDRALIPVQLWVSAGKILVATLVMAFVAHALAAFSIFVIIPVAAVVYIAAVAALRVLPREDLLHLKNAFFFRFKLRGARSPDATPALAHDSADPVIPPTLEELEVAS